MSTSNLEQLRIDRRAETPSRSPWKWLTPPLVVVLAAAGWWFGLRDSGDEPETAGNDSAQTADGASQQPASDESSDDGRIDAVVAHEMCHLVHLNHSPRFYALLDRFCPGHREAMKWLDRHQEELIL